MIGTKKIRQKIEDLSVGTLTQQTSDQLQGALCTLNASDLCAVATTAALPSAALNTGRFIYVTDCCAYRYSNGTTWTNDPTTTPVIVTSTGFAFGGGVCGQLGNNTATIAVSSPVSYVGGPTSWCDVGAGYSSLGIALDGTLWAWGPNCCGQLGDNTTVNKSSPVAVVGGFTDWCKISTGTGTAAIGATSLGVRTNGTIWSWGRNNLGQIGDSTTVSRSSPVSVVGGFTNWCDVSSGFAHALGIRTNGMLHAWGSNLCGALGDGTTVNKSSPVTTAGGFTDWKKIATASSASSAVRMNGTAWAWGYNKFGQLGDGTTVDKSSPVSVTGGFTDWCDITMGLNHTLALRTNGTAWAWGCNNFGSLGDGGSGIVNRSSPVAVAGGITNWCEISAGCNHSIGLTTAGELWGWGFNNLGQAGFNGSKSSPFLVLGGINTWCKMSAGHSHTLAVSVTSTDGFPTV